MKSSRRTTDTSGSARNPGQRRAGVGESGLSLVEVLVSAWILSLAAVGTALMFGTGSAYIDSEGDSRIALYLARQRVEQIRAAGYNAALANPTGATGTPVEVVENPVCNGVTPCEHPGFKRSTSIVCVSAFDFNVRVSCPVPGALAAKVVTVRVEPTPADPKAVPVTVRGALASP